METTAKFSINVIGEDSGNPYIGDFVVKTLLTRRDRFKADEYRRMLIGANPSEALPDMSMEAYVLGQLLVRIVEAPEWWKNSQNGELLADLNVILQVYELAKAKEDERKKTLQEEAEKAKASLLGQ